MLLFLLLVFSSLLCYYNFYWKRRKYPPGPTPLPFFGNILSVIKHEPGYEIFKTWREKYGPIYTYWLGESPVIMVSDYESIVELFVKDGETYTGRQKTPQWMNLVRGGPYGVVFTEGDHWRDQRKFALHVLKDLGKGSGRNLMEERVLEEVTSIIEKVQKDLKNGFHEHNIASYIEIGIGSLINNLLFGYRFDESRLNEFYELKRMASNYVRVLGTPWQLLIQKKVEFFKYVPFFRKYYYALKDARDVLMKFYKRQVKEHQENADNDSEPTDFVEAFLREKARREADGQQDKIYTMEQLLIMCWDLWVAGQDTTSNTMIWGILYLMTEPEIQAKLHKELDSVVGSDRIITMEDRSKLHYAAAVINEIQRIVNLMPLNHRRSTTRDVEIRGFHLPEGTEIIPQISTVLYDEQIFPNPHKFDPNRFLDKNGQWKKVEELIPFSVGKRKCLGEGLANMELFLFTANLFNQFKFLVAPNKPPTLQRKFGQAVTPQPFVCNIERRY